MQNLEMPVHKRRGSDSDYQRVGKLVVKRQTAGLINNTGSELGGINSRHPLHSMVATANDNILYFEIR